jgi:hypothetical protein
MNKTDFIEIIDEKLDLLLASPGMYASHLSGIETAIWMLIGLRIQAHPKLPSGYDTWSDPRALYNKLKKECGVCGNGIVAAVLADEKPAENGSAMGFYRKWVNAMRDEQDGKTLPPHLSEGDSWIDECGVYHVVVDGQVVEPGQPRALLEECAALLEWSNAADAVKLRERVRAFLKITKITKTGQVDTSGPCIDEYAPHRWRRRGEVVIAQRMLESFTTHNLYRGITGKAGDWMITGSAGERSVCDDATFRANYELVQEDQT